MRRCSGKEVEITIAAQFRGQNETLCAERRDQAKPVGEQSERLIEQNEMIRRLMRGVDRLVEELHGVRTGKAEEAFARFGGADASPDLPGVSAEGNVPVQRTWRIVCEGASQLSPRNDAAVMDRADKKLL